MPSFHLILKNTSQVGDRIAIFWIEETLIIKEIHKMKVLIQYAVIVNLLVPFNLILLSYTFLMCDMIV